MCCTCNDVHDPHTGGDPKNRLEKTVSRSNVLFADTLAIVESR